MSSGRLIFAFRNSVNLAVEQTHLANNPVIKFGMGFEDLDMLCNNPVITVAGPEEIPEGKPLIEFSVRETANRSSLKRKKEEAVTFPICDESSRTPAEPRVRSMITRPTLTKTQRRNKNRRMKKMYAKIARETEATEDCSGCLQT